MLANQIKTETVVINTAFTKMALLFESDILVGLDFFSDKKIAAPVSESSKEVCQQIDDYCARQLPYLVFDIKLETKGTAFQRRVWSALQKIPVGEVLTYGELAQQLKTSARAVGNACRVNPIPLVIPCHRVVAKTGLGGFAGSTDGRPMEIKKWLLAHEGVLL